MTEPEPAERTLGRKVRRGLGLSFANNAIVRAGTFLGGIVLARLLTPSDYGIYAVALVVLTAVLSMNELGVSVALVRWPGDTSRVAPTVATLSIASSAILFALCLAVASPVAHALHAPTATGILRLISLTVLLDGFTSVPVAMLSRGFYQGKRLLADLAGVCISTGLTIGLAAAGYGAWSLAWGQLAGAASVLIVLYIVAPQHVRPGFDREVVRELMRIGIPLAGSSFLVFGVLNVDYIIVGRFLGPTQLGFYLLAFNLSSWPVNLISSAVRRVTLAYFSQVIHADRDVSGSFANAFSLLLAITLPVCALLSILSTPLVTFVYGSKWEPAARVLTGLAILGLARVMFELCYDFLVAANKPRWTFVLQAWWLALLIPGLAIGANVDGIRGVAFGHATIAVILVGPAFIYAIHRSGVDLKILARGVVRPLGATAVLIGVVLAIDLWLHGDLARLVVSGGVAGLAYAAIIAPMRRGLRLDSAELDAPPT
jgi:O-antigen/teichoic acid export membrane protein